MGETLQDFTYDDVAPWPTSPDGAGPSLELTNPLADPANPLNWSASLPTGGTPGATYLPGDANHDSIVDLADFDIWFSHVSTPAPEGPASGDFDASGVVDLADFDLWFTHVGTAPTPLFSANMTLSVAPMSLSFTPITDPASKKRKPLYKDVQKQDRQIRTHTMTFLPHYYPSLTLRDSLFLTGVS